ncbi:MAG: hypothetical protein WC055_01900 [Melioribacteraceae bacterium]
MLTIRKKKIPAGIVNKNIQDGDYTAQIISISDALLNGVNMAKFTFSGNFGSLPVYFPINDKLIITMNNIASIAGLKEGSDFLDVLNLPLTITITNNQITFIK